MIVYHGAFCCERDNHCVQEHIQQLDSLRQKMSHCLYYGMESQVAVGYSTCKLGINENYENLPVKTVLMLQHALQYPWDVFLKTDINAKVASIKWDVVEKHRLTGFVSWQQPKLSPAYKQFQQTGLNGPCRVDTPKVWMGGPAYTLHRSLAEKVVEAGVWYARGWAYEDVMVARIAQEHGIVPVPAIGYIADGGRLDVNR